jgi:hypothetical protein
MTSGIPFESPVDNRRFYVKQVLRAGSAPSHLFLLAHAPVDQLIDGTLNAIRVLLIGLAFVALLLSFPSRS